MAYSLHYFQPSHGLAIYSHSNPFRVQPIPEPSHHCKNNKSAHIETHLLPLQGVKIANLVFKAIKAINAKIGFFFHTKYCMFVSGGIYEGLGLGADLVSGVCLPFVLMCLLFRVMFDGFKCSFFFHFKYAGLC
ncbi:hypothetical protein EGR_11059 [Echinococcus granulosus]|uniref:Uncharacterized protein n=1 Tax=Echinococcus granulosus TaxID=6210 RepID=W6U0V3_ECHGR|nr:hypothetical protein EGR_11059 [Echinococcus granulosus]EUB54081.1 hypothetical protein EGR_11059 [Echinococcus granulosus]